MKCREIKYFLLGSENPDQPPADVQAHLAVCTACQEWQNRLVQIEMNLPFLPVPQTAARNTLLKRILTQPQSSGQWAVGREQSAMGSEQAAVKLPTPSVSARSDLAADKPSGVRASPMLIPVVDRRASRIRAALSAFRSMEPGLRRFAGASVAAAILLGVLGWLVLHGPQQTPETIARIRPDPDPLLASILQRDLRLAEAENAKERMQALADLADDLSQEVKSLAPKAEAKDFLAVLVKNYQEVVAKGLVEVAKTLPDEGRNDILNDIGERLRRAGRQAIELAEANTVPDSSKKPLQQLRKIAWDADEQLRAQRIEAANPNDRPGNPATMTVAVQKERP